MDIKTLKELVFAEIDKNADRIIEIGEQIKSNPEMGYKEDKTASLVASELQKLGIEPKCGLAKTGVKGRLTGHASDVTVAVMGELDAVICDAALEMEEASERNLYHNDINTLARIKRIYEQNGVANEKTKFILSHVPTDKRRDIHDELSPIAAKLGMTVAYDGYFARI